MSRTSDEQIKSFENCDVPPDVIEALVSERARADAAEADSSLYARMVGTAAELSWTNGRRSAHDLIRTLWKSRRMWQGRALEAEELETACVREGIETEVAYIKELTEARAWAAWFAAEKAEIQKRLTRTCLEAMTTDMQAQANWEALERITALHHSTPVRWSSEGSEVQERCAHSGSLWPCDTEIARRGE